MFRLSRPFRPFSAIVCPYTLFSLILHKEWAISVGCWDGKADGWWRYHDIQKEKSPLYSNANGTGPFRFVEWDRAQQRVTLERFDGYWREPAKIKRVVIWNVGEWSTMKMMLERDDADIAAVPTVYLGQVEGVPGVVKDVLRGLGSRVPANLPSSLLGYNPNLPMYEFSIRKQPKSSRELGTVKCEKKDSSSPALRHW